MSDPVVLAVNVEPVQMGIAPAHGNLNGVMEIGDGLIAAQQNAAPDHGAHTPQNHLELVDASLTRFGHRSFIVSPALSPRSDSPVSPGILCSPARPRKLRRRKHGDSSSALVYRRRARFARSVARYEVQSAGRGVYDNDTTFPTIAPICAAMATTLGASSRSRSLGNLAAGAAIPMEAITAPS